jgi:hypothetical protein
MELWSQYVRDDERNHERLPTLIDGSVAEAAECALQYLLECGDNPNSKVKEASREVDRKVFRHIVAQWSEMTDRNYPINDSDIGRQIDLTQPQVRDRRICRAARIAKQLHFDAPDIWADNQRPVVEKIPMRKRRQREPEMKLAA